MYQKIILIGHLGGDPQMRYTADGTPVTSFSVATNRKWTDANDQQQEKTVWFRVTAWRKQAETCNQFLTKGQLVMVEGELVEPKPFQGRDGTWRASLEVTARNVKFLGGRGEGAAPPETPEGGEAPAKGDEVDETEIPF